MKALQTYSVQIMYAKLFKCTPALPIQHQTWSPSTAFRNARNGFLSRYQTLWM